MENTALVKDSIFKTAFLNQYNLIVLGGMALLSLASGSVALLVVAGVAELVWLIVGAPSVPFRRWVARQEQRQAELRWRAHVEKTAATIDPDAAVRLKLVGGTFLGVLRSCFERAPGDFEAAVTPRLQALLQNFATLVATHQRLSVLMNPGGAKVAEAEVARLTAGLAQEQDPALRISLRQAAALAQGRLRRIVQSESVTRDLTARMVLVETSLAEVESKARAGTPFNELLLLLDQALVSSRYAPEHELEASRNFGERRMTSGLFTIIPPTGEVR